MTHFHCYSEPKRIFLGLALILALGFSVFSRGEAVCGDICANSSVCPTNDCKLCDPDIGRCVTCCTYDDEDCPTSDGCVVVDTECRNEAGESCTGVPEVPAASKPWVWGGMLVLAAGFGWIARMKTLRNSKR